MPSILIRNKYMYFTDNAQTPGDGPTTTIFIHGLGSSSSFYHTIIPSLTPVTRCIALDIRGSGQSPLGGLHQSIDSIALDVTSLLYALDIKEVFVVGHSIGGTVASCLAAGDKRVKGVVLLGPINPSPSLTEVFEKRGNAVQKGSCGPVIHWDGLESLANSIPAAATGRFAKPLHHAFIRSLILGTSVEGYISLCGVIAEANVPDYARIQVPLLIVAGQDDKTAPLSGCNEILKAYGTSEKKKSIKVVDGVGHWHCVENPDSIAQKVRFFIDQYRKDVSTV